MSKKRLLALVFASCFNLLKSKVNPDELPTNLGRHRFFFACGEALGRAGDELEPHDLALNCLAVLLAFFLYLRISSSSASSTSLYPSS